MHSHPRRTISVLDHLQNISLSPVKNSFWAAQLKDFPRLKEAHFELLAHHYLCSFFAHLLTDKVQTSLRPHRPFIQGVWEKEDNKDRQREKDRESESLWSGLVELFSHNALPNSQDGAERNYSERIISKDRGEEMLWLTPSKLEPQAPFPSIPPLYLFVTLIHFWHCARAFSRVKKKSCWNSNASFFFFSSITSSSVLDVTVAAPWCECRSHPREQRTHYPRLGNRAAAKETSVCLKEDE